MLLSPLTLLRIPWHRPWQVRLERATWKRMAREGWGEARRNQGLLEQARHEDRIGGSYRLQLLG